MNETDLVEETFLSAWVRLAAAGVCDAPHGAEYRRILFNYRRSPYGMHPEEYIRWLNGPMFGEIKNGKHPSSQQAWWGYSP